MAVGIHLRFSLRNTRGPRSRMLSSYRFACRLAEILIVLVLLLMIATGISLARHLFALIEPPLRPSLARPLHRVLAHIGFLLIGIHLGLRLPGFRGLIGFRQRTTSKSWFFRISCYLICVAMALYGLAAANRQSYFRISLQSNLVTFESPNYPLIFFISDQAAIFSLAIIIGALLRRLLCNNDIRRRNKG